MPRRRVLGVGLGPGVDKSVFLPEFRAVAVLMLFGLESRSWADLSRYCLASQEIADC